MEQFENRKRVFDWLAANGYESSQMTFYRHCHLGRFAGGREEGPYTFDDVRKYQKSVAVVEPTMTGLVVERYTKEIKLLEAQIKSCVRDRHWLAAHITQLRIDGLQYVINEIEALT